jgi:hypothetical protein
LTSEENANIENITNPKVHGKETLVPSTVPLKDLELKPMNLKPKKTLKRESDNVFNECSFALADFEREEV